MTRLARMVLTAVGWVFAYGLLFVVAFPIYGMLVAYEWGWFVGPIIGEREITVVQGIGLGMFITTAGIIATAHLKKWEAPEGDLNATLAAGVGDVIAVGIVTPLGTLGVAWLWHNFAM